MKLTSLGHGGNFLSITAKHVFAICGRCINSVFNGSSWETVMFWWHRMCRIYLIKNVYDLQIILWYNSLHVMTIYWILLVKWDTYWSVIISLHLLLVKDMMELLLFPKYCKDILHLISRLQLHVIRHVIASILFYHINKLNTPNDKVICYFSK